MLYSFPPSIPVNRGFTVLTKTLTHHAATVDEGIQLPTSILACAAGYKRSDSDTDDFTACKPCIAARGEYASSVGSQKCDTIPPGSYAKQEGGWNIYITYLNPI